MTVTQTATFLFTDLVGSTALSSSLSPDAADELRRAHLSLLRGAMASTGGVEVKSLGDGVMAIFTSPTRALACGVAIQRAVERHNRRSQPALAVRIGISIGEAVEEAGDYFGDVVVEAARLCALADGGQILAADAVRAVVGRHATQELVPLGGFELKGLPQPVDVIEVRWEPEEPSEGTGEVPMPAWLVTAVSEQLFGFCGRVRELEQIDQELKHVVAERRLRLVFVSGEPGVGKSALVAKAAVGAHATGATVSFGGCDERLGVPYEPWIGVVSHLVTHGAVDLDAAVGPVHVPALVRLLPTLSDRTPSPPAGDLEAERFLGLEGVCRLFHVMSVERPMVIVLDDLQWADAASMLVLRHLMRSQLEMRVLVLVTYRESDLGREHPLTELLAGAHAEVTVRRVSLRGLDDAEVVELVEVAAGRRLDAAGVALAQAVYRETDGNPFFVAELLRHLGESGAIAQTADGSYTVTSGGSPALPSSVREVVSHRVARLGPEPERMLSIAAIVGHEFDIDVIAAVAEAEEDAVLDALELAVGAALVVDHEERPGRYRFVHALIQHTLEQQVSPTRRQRLHLQVARVLEERGSATSAELARHWLAATRPADTDRAVLYGLRAADEAMAGLAPVDAAAWYERTLKLLVGEDENTLRRRADTMIRLSVAERFAGAPFQAAMLGAGDLAHRLGDTDVLVAAALAPLEGVAYMDMREPSPPQQALVRDAPAAASPGTPDHVKLLLAAGLLTDPCEWRERHRLCDEAIAIARRMGDERLFAQTVAAAHMAANSPDRVERMGADAAMAGEIVRSSGDLMLEYNVIPARMHVAVTTHNVSESEALLDRIGAVARALPIPFVEWEAHMWRSWWTLMRGDPATAEQAAEEALSFAARAGSPDGLSTYGAQLAQVRAHQGRLHEVIDVIAAAADEVRTIPAYRALLTWMYCEVDQLDDARMLLDDIWREGLDLFPFDTTWTNSMCYTAESAVALGRRDVAAATRDRLAPYASLCRFNLATMEGSVADQLGVLDAFLGDSAAAERQLREALARHEEWRSPHMTARTQLALAAVLNTAGRRGEGQELLADASTTAATHGYAQLAILVRRASM